MKKIIVIVLMLFYSSFSWAVNTVPVQSNEEIVGCWKLIDFSEKVKRKMNTVDPWPVKYQWFCFDRDGTLNTVSSSVENETSESELRKAFNILPKEIKYSIPQKGVMITEHKSVNQKLAWGIKFTKDPIVLDGKNIEKHTLIMILFDNKIEKPIYHRFLRRIQ